MTIKITGAGISGLTAAINLAQLGYEVEVYEKRKDIGSRFKGDFQGLENWTSKVDMLDFLYSINIPTNFYYEPFRECFFYDKKLNKFNLESDKPGFYLIKRGPGENTLDRYLYNVALEQGVKFYFNTKQFSNETDIIATGTDYPYLIALGINFETNLEKIALALFDNDLAPNGYAYLLGLHGKGTIAVVTKAGTKGLKDYLEKAIQRFSDLIDFEIKNSDEFSGTGTIYRNNRFEGKPKLGEAGGFQDAMWGFGLRFAFHTGFLSAQAIDNNLDYFRLVQKEIVPYCKSSAINRFLYDKIISKNYYLFLKGLTIKDPIRIANIMYKPNFLKNLMYPITNKFI